MLVVSLPYGGSFYDANIAIISTRNNGLAKFFFEHLLKYVLIITRLA